MFETSRELDFTSVAYNTQLFWGKHFQTEKYSKFEALKLTKKTVICEMQKRPFI